jgi:hypothetical protein
MAAYLLTGWDTSRVGAMSLYADDGTDDGTVTLTTGTYCHRDLSSVMGTGEYTDLVTELNARLDAVLTGSGFDTVSWSSSTLKYTLTSSPNVSLDFRSATLGSDAGQRLAAALGYNYNHGDATGGSAGDPYDILLSGAASYVSNVVPAYALALSRDGVTDYSRPFEPPGQTMRQVSRNANAYSIGPSTYEKRWTAKWRFQTLATVFAAEADDTAAPWTYEDLLEHARCWEPALLSYTGASAAQVFKFVEAEFSDKARSPVWNNYHGKWDLKVSAQHLGEI